MAVVFAEGRAIDRPETEQSTHDREDMRGDEQVGARCRVEDLGGVRPEQFESVGIDGRAEKSDIEDGETESHCAVAGCERAGEGRAGQGCRECQQCHSDERGQRYGGRGGDTWTR